jgi:uncharacterized repeat protein (TIGR02543 family)
VPTTETATEETTTEEITTEETTTEETTNIKNIFNIKFDYNGGIKSTAQISVTNGTQYGKLPKAKRRNYQFSGWYTSKIGGTKVSESTTVKLNSDQILYSHWKKVIVSKKIRITRFRQRNGKISLRVADVKLASGYVIYCSYNKKFKNAKKITVTNTKKSCYTFVIKNKLTKAKIGYTYYYRICPYIIDSTGKKVLGKYGKTYDVLYRS